MSHTTSPALTVFSFNSLSGAFEKVASAVQALMLRLHNAVANGIEERVREEQDADLAEATDRYDLEFRMRKQDRSGGGSYWSNGLNR